MADMSPEQVEELKEKLKNMSPEELREFQKKQCIFCHIVAGRAQAKKVYEDEHCIGILDINPANPGHVLLLPKEHYAIMPQIPDKEIMHLGITAKKLSHALLRALHADGTNIFIANGVVAGQKAQHFMIHIIPRKEHDEVGIDIPEKLLSKQQLQQVKQHILPSIAKSLGARLQEQPVAVEQVSPKEQSAVPAPRHEPREVVIEDTPRKAQPKAPKKEHPKKDQTKDEDVTLDDIADLLGGS
ncbi:HIT domain-containing protein [Candidatus Woesearchaeota archaeon]|nr:HIT domain-containing protein [Candidatus Woesearchaeota archaeon]